MSEHNPDLDITGLRTSLKVTNRRLHQLGIQSQGPIKSFAEAKACGKVIISGEHAVVYGAKALALPLLSKIVNIKLYADPQSNASPKIRINLGERPANEAIKAMVLDAFDVLEIGRFNLSVEGYSTLMLGAGVGSSASLCVSILRGLSQLSGKNLSPLDLAKKANQLERRFHGNPSGLDTAVVALEQAILFEKGKDPTVVTVKPPTGERFPWAFVLLDSGVRTPTINMVKHAEPVFRSRGKPFLDEFDQVTDACKKALETGDSSLMAESLKYSHMLLTEVGIVDSVLHDITRIAFKIGVKAIKVTGAGGGGCMLALLENSACDDQISKLREQLGKDRVHPFFVP
jgi:mevalonate kinase